MLTPPPLKPGDTVAILSPATTVRPEYIDGAARFLEEHGFRALVMPAAKGPAAGTYAATEERRADDFMAALADPDVKAILCARGGYGCVHLLPRVPLALVRNNPKWVIGFSDVSALHALMQRAGVASLHAGMARHLCENPDTALSVATFLGLLGGATDVTYRFDAAAPDAPRVLLPGTARGTLRGGNLAVLDGLSGTGFDLLRILPDEDVILFLEDVGEAVYRTERMLWRLWLDGTLSRVRGLVLGDFSESGEDINFGSPQAMIEARLRQWGVSCPVVAGFPAGHVTGRNLPLVEGWDALLSADGLGVTLTMRQP